MHQNYRIKASLHRVDNVEGQPAEAEDDADPDEQVGGPPHARDVVLDPLHDGVAGGGGGRRVCRVRVIVVAVGACSATAAVAGCGCGRAAAGRQLVQLLLHSDPQLTEDLKRSKNAPGSYTYFINVGCRKEGESSPKLKETAQ